MLLPLGGSPPNSDRVDNPARILAVVSAGGLFDLYCRVGVPTKSREIPSDLDPDEIVRSMEFAPGFELDPLGAPLAGLGSTL